MPAKRKQKGGGRPPWDQNLQREKLLRASIRVFLKRGYHPARIEDLVREAEASKSTFYLFFKDKEELLACAIDLFFQELRMALSWTQESIDPKAPIESIFKQEAQRIFQSLVAHQDVARLIFREGRAAGPRISRKVHEFTLEMMKVSSETLRAAVAFKLLPEIDTEAAAACIVGSIAFSYGLWLEKGVSLGPEALADSVLEFLLRGCGLPARAALA